MMTILLIHQRTVKRNYLSGFDTVIPFHIFKLPYN
jgi:hypothetical protein